MANDRLKYLDLEMELYISEIKLRQPWLFTEEVYTELKHKAVDSILEGGDVYKVFDVMLNRELEGDNVGKRKNDDGNVNKSIKMTELEAALNNLNNRKQSSINQSKSQINETVKLWMLEQGLNPSLLLKDEEGMQNDLISSNVSAESNTITESNQAGEVIRCSTSGVRLLTGGLSVDKMDHSGLYVENQKPSEKAAYAKELASAAVELRKLVDEVTKLSLGNAKLEKELGAACDLANFHNHDAIETGRKGQSSGIVKDVNDEFNSWKLDQNEIKNEDKLYVEYPERSKVLGIIFHGCVVWNLKPPKPPDLMNKCGSLLGISDHISHNVLSYLGYNFIGVTKYKPKKMMEETEKHSNGRVERVAWVFSIERCPKRRIVSGGMDTPDIQTRSYQEMFENLGNSQWSKNGVLQMAGCKGNKDWLGKTSKVGHYAISGLWRLLSENGEFYVHYMLNGDKVMVETFEWKPGWQCWQRQDNVKWEYYLYERLDQLLLLHLPLLFFIGLMYAFLLLFRLLLPNVVLQVSLNAVRLFELLNTNPLVLQVCCLGCFVPTVLNRSISCCRHLSTILEGKDVFEEWVVSMGRLGLVNGCHMEHDLLRYTTKGEIESRFLQSLVAPGEMIGSNMLTERVLRGILDIKKVFIKSGKANIFDENEGCMPEVECILDTYAIFMPKVNRIENGKIGNTERNMGTAKKKFEQAFRWYQKEKVSFKTLSCYITMAQICTKIDQSYWTCWNLKKVLMEQELK